MSFVDALFTIRLAPRMTAQDVQEWVNKHPQLLFVESHGYRAEREPFEDRWQPKKKVPA